MKSGVLSSIDMKTRLALLKAPFRTRITEKELPDLSPGYVLLKIMACSVCGGDIHGARSNEDWQPFGHEVSGIVTSTSADVSSVKSGDKVAVESTSFCGRCDNCRNGKVELCSDREWLNKHDLSGFGDYLIVKEKNLVPFEGISFEEAALLEPFGVAVDLVMVSDVGINDNVLIVGLGSIGLMALQLLQYRTAGTICGVVSSGSKRKIELARKYGIQDLMFYDKEELQEHHFPVEKFDRILITASPEEMPPYLECAEYGGTISYIGFGGDPNITINANTLHTNKIKFIPSFASPGIYYPLCIDLVKRKKIDLSTMISKRFSLKDVQSGLNHLKNDRETAIKAVMVDKSLTGKV
jgi:L-iditol 2-dehydrogenase